MKKYLKPVIILCAYCYLLVQIRVGVSGSSFYQWMLWNLFLAAVPFFITYLYSLYPKNKIRTSIKYLIFFVVLLFWPNAPYLVTDLLHLPEWVESFPLWYDYILLFMFAFVGIILWNTVLVFWAKKVKEHSWNIFSWIFIISFLLISSFGVYVWRFLRFNSWDLVNNIWKLFQEISQSFYSPKMYFFTFTFFSMLYVSYMTFYYIEKWNEK